MEIVNLVENTEGAPGCLYEHGLSFYIETSKHKALLDLGQTDLFAQNAKTLGIDLEAVDTVILSHGHYDHAGGILPFTRINDRAPIYMQKTAGGAYFADDGKVSEGHHYRYIGIDEEILGLQQLRLIEGDHVIDEQLELFTIQHRTHPLPFPNKRLLMQTETGYTADTFAHEQFLVVKDGGQRVLLSGCAHNGILSILDAYREKYDSLPDVVISGFHLMVKREYREKELEEIREIAKALSTYPIRYYTCHCTGEAAFDEMKQIMGEQLQYVHSGMKIN